MEAMKAGAHDYVLKQRLSRLVPASGASSRRAPFGAALSPRGAASSCAEAGEPGPAGRRVAHDFNNLLTGILGNASLAMDSVSPESDVRAMLQGVVKAAERAADLTRPAAGLCRQRQIHHPKGGRFVAGARYQ